MRIRVKEELVWTCFLDFFLMCNGWNINKSTRLSILVAFSCTVASLNFELKCERNGKQKWSKKKEI